MRCVLQICSWATLAVLTLFLAACPDEEAPAGQYTCANGTPSDGAPDGADDVERCAECVTGYILENNACRQAMHTCANGQPASGNPVGVDADFELCASCEDDYTLVNGLCEQLSYTCANGTPVGGIPPDSSDRERCDACDPGYYENGTVCAENVYRCPGGTPAPEGTRAPEGTPAYSNDDVVCAACNPGYYENGTVCAENVYRCPNGTRAPNGTPAPEGTPAYSNDDVVCAECDLGHALVSADNTCATDTDDDGIADIEDVDDDNNGLIEIHNLDMLHNIRWNLAGTTYDDEEADTDTGDAGDTTGAPEQAMNTECTTATDGVYLCGYELVDDLDFAEDDDYASGTINADWRPDGGNAATATNGGWPGIGTNNFLHAATLRFSARFEGNGYTISNLYLRGRLNIGLFNITTSVSHIANVGVIDAELYGNDGSVDSIGALVGRSEGRIVGCYASATISGGERNDIIGALIGTNTGSVFAAHASGSVNGGAGNDSVGGLIGSSGNNNVIGGSYATTTVNGDSGNDNVGGLIGFSSTHISGSYATGAVNGGADEDNVGGLVGRHSVRTISATYAIGNVNGDGDDDDVGGLIGETTSGRIIANYATGNVDGGDGDNDNVGAILGNDENVEATPPIQSYGFGTVTGETEYTDEDNTVGFMASDASALQITDSAMNTTYAGGNWTEQANHAHNAWDFASGQDPAVRYADYDDDGATMTVFDCADYPSTIPGTTTTIVCGTTLLPDQR